MYGRQKLAGEKATLAARASGANAAAVRVPVL
jgi:dTDP-4-dehydrorhamnose reductase